jgi:diaminopimelate dehydrogenase
MINIGIVGLGNIGRGVVKAIKNIQDMRLTAIFTRRVDQDKKEINNIPVIDTTAYDTVTDISIDVAILCGSSKADIPVQGPLFARKFNTVDSYDMHKNIPEHFKAMDIVARENNNVSVISAGWDPGIFSLERVLGNAFLPGSKDYTFWGPGVSQGHSDAARKVRGVIDARQYTIPVVEAMDLIRQGESPQFLKKEMHKRIVYVVAKEGEDQARIRVEIQQMPQYFADYDTEVKFISAEEMKKNHSNYPHGGFVFTSGEISPGSNQILEYRCNLSSNPDFTANVLISCARAAYRLKQMQQKGAFTMLDIPPALFSPLSADILRSRFM